MTRRDPVDRVLGLDMPNQSTYDPIFNRLHQATPKPAIPYHPDQKTDGEFKLATGDGR